MADIKIYGKLVNSTESGEIANYSQISGAPIIEQDLSVSGFTPIVNSYYKHIGATSTDYIKNVIYFYDANGYKKIDGSGGDVDLTPITIAEIDELFSEPITFTLNISYNPFAASSEPMYVKLDSNIADASHWDYRVVAGNQIEKKDGTTFSGQMSETVAARIIAFSNVQQTMIVHKDDTETTDIASPYILQQNDREVYLISYRISTNAAIEEQPIV